MLADNGCHSEKWQHIRDKPLSKHPVNQYQNLQIYLEDIFINFVVRLWQNIRK